MKLLRTYLAIALALVLVVTTHSMAVARGTSMPMDQVVLCTGTGPAVVLVDRDGQPVTPPHSCPDCTLGALALNDVAPDPILRPLGQAIVLRLEPIVQLRQQPARPASARGPPVPV